MPQKYQNAEAFCLMRYRCEKCNHVEVLWNSRDGVTPFVIGCVKCGKPAKHVDWKLDRRVPDYDPPKGSRIFVTMTSEEYLKSQTKRVEHFWKDDVHGFRSIYKTKLRANRAFVTLDDFTEGMPEIKIVE